MRGVAANRLSVCHRLQSADEPYRVVRRLTHGRHSGPFEIETAKQFLDHAYLMTLHCAHSCG